MKNILNYHHFSNQNYSSLTETYELTRFHFKISPEEYDMLHEHHTPKSSKLQYTRKKNRVSRLKPSHATTYLLPPTSKYIWYLYPSALSRYKEITYNIFQLHWNLNHPEKHYLCKIFWTNLYKFLCFETKNYKKEITFINFRNIQTHPKGNQQLKFQGWIYMLITGHINPWSLRKIKWCTWLKMLSY